MTCPGNQILNLPPAQSKAHSPQRAVESSDGAETPQASFINILQGSVESSQNESKNTKQVVLLHTDNVESLASIDQYVYDAPLEGKILSDAGGHSGEAGLSNQLTMSMTDRLASQILDISLLDIAPGKFEIVDSSVTDGVLHLKVVDKNNKLNFFAVSIPLEHLPKSVNMEMLQGAMQLPTELDPFGPEKLKLEDYFSELNLKEIQIASGREQKLTSSAAEPIPTIVTAQNMGQVVTIQDKLLRHALGIPTENDSTDMRSAEENVGLEKNPSTDNHSASTVDASRSFLKVNTPVENLKLFGDASLFEKNEVSQDQSESTEEKGMKIFSGLEIADQELGSDKTTIRQVRFTLPDQIKSSFKPNIQTLTLRIEPEYLGPARLTLMMHNDKLQARVIVKNYHAKVAVEASLNQLVDQLSKAHIEVDHIDVMVDGNAARNGFYKRRPQWHYRANRSERLDQSGTVTLHRGSPIEDSMPRPTAYFRAGGVNILA